MQAYDANPSGIRPQSEAVGTKAKLSQAQTESRNAPAHGQVASVTNVTGETGDWSLRVKCIKESASGNYTIKLGCDGKTIVPTCPEARRVLRLP